MASPAPTTPEKEKAVPAKVEKDAGLIRKVLSIKSLGLIKAWEESEKTKVDNKAKKKFSNVVAWELSKQATIDARQKKYEQKLEKKKALYVEKMQNKLAEIHKAAEEKRAMVVEGKRIEHNKVGKKADDFREVGLIIVTSINCFCHCDGFLPRFQLFMWMFVPTRQRLLGLGCASNLFVKLCMNLLPHLLHHFPSSIWPTRGGF
ncbi:unnamed protein product [Malus baccata var. baccata]